MVHVENLAEIVDAVCRDMQAHLGRGRVADYIPALARIDPRQFGIAVATCDGRMIAAGDAGTPFSVQSISKIFTLTLALNRQGADVWRRVGREPSGSPFNSIVQLEQEKGIPRNPLINAGAIVVSDILLEDDRPGDTIAGIADLMRRLADDPTVSIDPEVARSEAETGFRNRSLANFLRAFDNLHGPVADVLQVYFHQCALAMNCRQLARAGLYLAHDGADPLTGARMTTPLRAQRINAMVMKYDH